MEAFKLEWESLISFIAGKEIVSIYFGGGTPSLLGAEAIGTILDWTGKRNDGIEITLEANPENISKHLMQDYKDAGVNRVSIGIQTLDNQLLKLIGRLHSSQKAIESVYNTFDAGIHNISIDLMYDLPSQNLTMWENTLNQVTNLPITHLSLYNLTIEPHTVFFKQQESIKKLIPDEETSLEMYEMATHILNEKLTQYEISAFSAPGKQSHHNVGYWVGRPFFGLGPSAFSYYDNKRFRNVANLSRYHKQLLGGKSPIDFEEELEVSSRLRELLAINLRLCEGVNLVKFQEKNGILDSETIHTLKKLDADGFIERTGDNVSLTRRGILFYDTVAVEII
jgi:oxygen-independent coproporphyrinogen-3 oxidase